jgi:hypothetical protein
MPARAPGGDLPSPDDVAARTRSPDDEVRLEVPAESRFARVVRIAVSALAVRRGFDVSVVEDLRIAVDESLILLLRAARPVPPGEAPGTGPGAASMVLTLSGKSGEIRVDLRVVPAPPVDPREPDARDALSRFAELVPPRVVVDEVDPVDGHVALLLGRRN